MSWLTSFLLTSFSRAEQACPSATACSSEWARREHYRQADERHGRGRWSRSSYHPRQRGQQPREEQKGTGVIPQHQTTGCFRNQRWNTARDGPTRRRHPSPSACEKHGRHYYDIYQLLGDNRVIALLNDRKQVEIVTASIQEVTDAYFTREGEPRKIVRPRADWASSPAFDPSDDRLAKGYAISMERLSSEPRKCPRFPVICARAREHADLP